VEVAVLREQVLQPLVLDETVADEVPAVVALDPAVGGFALGAGLGGAAVEAAEDLAEVGLGADRAALVVGGPGDGVFADMGRGGGGAVDAAGAVVAQRGGDAVAQGGGIGEQPRCLGQCVVQSLQGVPAAIL